MFAALYAPSLPMAALVDVARAFTPRYEQLGSIVLLDAGGLSRLFGSAQELGEHLRDALSKPSPGDTNPCISIASTQTAAALLALGAPGLTVVMPGKEAIALSPLSVNVLDRFEKLASASAPAQPAELRRDRAQEPAGAGWHHPRTTHQASRGKRRAPDNRLLEILTKWGIRTLGALTSLSGPELHERLGERGAYWQSLARGIDARPMVPWVDEVPFEAALELEWPIEGLEPLSFVLARLLEPLSERLERADRGAAALFTSLRLTSRTVFTRTLQLPAPMRDPKTLRTLILLDFETHPPDAPIDTVRVLIEPTPAKVLQWTLLDRAHAAPEQVTTLTARLTALMGEGHVGSPRVVDSWKPGAFAMAAFSSQQSRHQPSAISHQESAISNQQSAISNQESAVSNQQSGIGHQQSPVCHLKSAFRRFRFPIPARVTVSEGKPVRVQVDRQGFTSGAISQSAGPWRTSGYWWDTPGTSCTQSTPGTQGTSGTSSTSNWDRDEWDVAMNDGTVYRLVVERGIGQWFLEGVID